MHSSEFIGLIILIYFQSITIGRVYQVVEILKIAASYEDGEVVMNSTAWMTKLSRTVSVPNVDLILTEELQSVPTIAELFRVFGAQTVPLPFNLSGDGCKFLATNYLIVPDLKASGNLGNCPIKKGPVYVHNLQVHQENWPTVGIEGMFNLRLSFFHGRKKIFVVETGLRLTISKIAPPYIDLSELNKTVTNKNKS